LDILLQKYVVFNDFIPLFVLFNVKKTLKGTTR